MPFARIIASKPSSARDVAQALRQAGYKVEIVQPGAPPSTEAVDLEFDADTDTVLSQIEEEFVPGQREFVLAPLWRKWSAKYFAKRDVARAEREISSRPAPAVRQSAPVAVEPVQTVLVAEERRRAAADAARTEEAARAEALRQYSVQEEEAQRHQESARQQELSRQQELARQQVRQQEQQQLAMQRQEETRQREAEQQRLAALRQDEERQWQQEVVRREAEEAARQRQLACEREELRQQEVLRRQVEEEHRQEVLRVRHEEELARRVEGQRLLIEANKQREESVRQRAIAIPAETPVETSSVPSIREYLALRLNQWKQARAANAKVTPIDGSGFGWRKAWPITAGVAAAFLLGWGIAVYSDSSPKPAAQSTPQALTPAQYAPYPTAKVSPSRRIIKPPAAHNSQQVKRRAARSSAVAEDEVVVHHYYPSKTATAQNHAPQRKKISDLN